MTQDDLMAHLHKVSLQKKPGECLACKIIVLVYGKGYCDIHMIDWAADQLEQEKQDVPEGNRLRPGNP